MTRIPSRMPPGTTSGEPAKADPTQWPPQPGRDNTHSSPPCGQHLFNHIMKRQVNSTGPNMLPKQVKTHRRPPTIASRLFQGIHSIFQRHRAKTPAYPMREGVCYHPKIQNLDKEFTTDEDKPYSPQPSLSRGDENLWITLTGPRSHWTETIPVATFRLFLNPLEIPNINTLA